MESTMTGEESFITAIISQAIEDTTYTGTSKKKIKFKMDAIDWIVVKAQSNVTKNNNSHQKNKSDLPIVLYS